MLRPLTAENAATLQAHYESGLPARAAARDLGIGVSTIYRYFHRFKRAGLVRVKRKRILTRKPFWRVPRYTGPTWIGKACE